MSLTRHYCPTSQIRNRGLREVTHTPKVTQPQAARLVSNPKSHRPPPWAPRAPRGEHRGSGAGWSRRGGPRVSDLMGTFQSTGLRPARAGPAPLPRGSAQDQFLLDSLFSHLIVKGRERETTAVTTLCTPGHRVPGGTPRCSVAVPLGVISQALPAWPSPRSPPCALGAPARDVFSVRLSYSMRPSAGTIFSVGEGGTQGRSRCLDAGTGCGT